MESTGEREPFPLPPSLASAPSVQNGTGDRLHWALKWPQDASRWLKMASRWLKMAQDGPRWPQDGPRWPQDGPRWPQDGSRYPQDGPRWPQHGLQMAPRGPQEEAKNLEKTMVFLWFLHIFAVAGSSFILSILSYLSKRRERPKTSPRRPQDGSKSA